MCAGVVVRASARFPQIIAGFNDIVSTATTSIAQMQGSAPITSSADAASITEAFRRFVRVHQALLNILIGKAGLFKTVPFIGAPVAEVLRQVENVVDVVASGLADLVQSQASQIRNDDKSLDSTMGAAIKVYEGLSLS